MSTPSDHDDDPYLVTSELEIRSILRSIQRRAVLMRMYVKGNSDQSVMTTVLGFDDTTGRVIVDSSQDPELNGQLVQAATVVFDAQVDQISIHFSVSQVKSCTQDNLPALSFPLPVAVRRVQRREYYRVEIPVNEPLNCAIPIAERGKPARRVELKAKDISAGGLALLDTDHELPSPQAGVSYKGVMLNLPEVGEVAVDIDVLRVHTHVLPNKKEIIELACQFAEMSRATSMQIQTYIGRLERRLNAKRRGY